jgi:hypothetical protein
MAANQTSTGIERGIEETFFALDQIAERLQLSKESVRRIFSREPGVLRFNSLGKAALQTAGFDCACQAVFTIVWLTSGGIAINADSLPPPS